MGNVRPEPAFYGRHQMLNLGVTFESEKIGCLNGAVFTHSSKVIAHQIGDHHQLCALLLAGLQFVGKAGVLVGIGGARASAFDGAGLDVSAAQFKKKLRRRGGDLDIAAVQPGGKGSRRDVREAPIELPAVGIERGFGCKGIESDSRGPSSSWTHRAAL